MIHLLTLWLVYYIATAANGRLVYNDFILGKQQQPAQVRSHLIVIT